MKKISTALFFFIQFTLLGQEIRNLTYISKDTTVGSVASIGYWSKNESKSYEVLVEKNTYEGDSLIKSKTNLHFLYNISIIDSTEHSYEIKWKFVKNLKENNIDLNSLNLDEAFLGDSAFQELSISYRTDEFGTFDEYTDNSKIIELVNYLSQKVVENIADTIPENEKEKYKIVMNRLLTPEYIWNKTFGESIQQFHFFHGFGCGINDTIRYEETLPVPKFKTKLDLETYLFVSSNNPETSECQFSYNKFGNGKEVMKLGLEVYEGIIPEVDQESIEASKDKEYNFQIISHHYVNTNTGWPNFIEFYREIGYQLEDKPEITHQDAIFIYPHEE